MGCPGCEYEPTMKNLQFEQTLTKAIDYAKEKQKAVVIYKEVTGTYQYAEYEFACSQGYPIERIVSQHVRSTP